MSEPSRTSIVFWEFITNTTINTMFVIGKIQPDDDFYHALDRFQYERPSDANLEIWVKHDRPCFVNWAGNKASTKTIIFRETRDEFVKILQREWSDFIQIYI